MARPAASQPIKSLNTGPGSRRFVFKTFSQRIEDVDINVFRSLEPVNPEPTQGSTFFKDALVYWRELNTAEDFISLYEELMPLVQTLPQILYHKDSLVSKLTSRLNMHARLSLEPILRMGSFCQFLVLLVEVLKGSFSERYIYEILPVLERILKVGLVISEKHGAVKEKCVNDASHSLQMMEKLLLQFPDLCSEKPFESMWELVVGFLMHPVERLQETSSCLINSYFRTSSKQAYLKEREPSEEVVPSLLQPSRLFTIAASLCCQLEAHPAGLNYTSNIIIENLVVSICGVHSFVKQNHDNNLHQLWSSLAASDHELILKFLEVLGAKTEGSILSSFGNEYPCVDLASLLVLPLLRKLGAAVLQSHDLEQVKMVFGCLSLISTRIGLEGCIKYADPLLLPLYKICEGFAGQVFTDEVKHLAEDLRDRIRGIMGMEEFVRVYDRIRKDVKLKREKRKQVEKLTAVVNPMRSAKRKLKIREKHRSHKKRKLMLMKMGKWNRV